MARLHIEDPLEEDDRGIAPSVGTVGSVFEELAECQGFVEESRHAGRINGERLVAVAQRVLRLLAAHVVSAESARPLELHLLIESLDRRLDHLIDGRIALVGHRRRWYRNLVARLNSDEPGLDLIDRTRAAECAEVNDLGAHQVGELAGFDRVQFLSLDLVAFEGAFVLLLGDRRVGREFLQALTKSLRDLLSKLLVQHL